MKPERIITQTIMKLFLALDMENSELTEITGSAPQ